MNTTELQCHKCGNSFSIQTKEYNRQTKKGRTYFFCSLSCSSTFRNTTTENIVKKCLWCKNEFDTTTHKKARKCCSIECSKKYARTFVDTKNISTSLKKYNELHGRCKKYPKEKDFYCIICNSKFIRLVKDNVEDRKTCSDICYRKLISQYSRNNPNCGGGTNYKKYKYNDVWMDSSWEVEIAKMLDERNIKWERDRKKHMFWWTDITGQKRRYYPDFYLPDYNVYLDPKNKHKIEKDKYKIEKVIEENKITIFWGLLENVKKEIDILRSV